MSELKAYDPDNDQENGDQSNDMKRVAKEENPADDGPCGTDASPNRVGGSNGDCFHRLGDAEEAQHDKDKGDDAGNKTSKPLAVFKSDGEADFKKTCENKEGPSK